MMTIVILITVMSIIQLNQESSDNKGQVPTVKVDEQFSSMKSIAQPNWWIKPAITAKVKHPPKKRVTNNAEPISNFLILPEMNNWQLQKNKAGIASATYQFKRSTDNNKHYELAIIRMNGKVALNNVLSIWQSKTGLSSEPKPLVFSTKKKQTFKLFTFKGEQKSIFVAAHKKQKYTFFRLSTIEQNNQKSDLVNNAEIEQIFKDFLAEIYIYN